MILGLGIDLVEISRVDRGLEKFGDAYLQRVLCPDEIVYCKRHHSPAKHVAARIAVKEAVSKAFGTGIGAELGWHDIEVTRKECGQPGVTLHGHGEELMWARGVKVIHVSLTHTDSYASAVAVLEGDRNRGTI